MKKSNALVRRAELLALIGFTVTSGTSVLAKEIRYKEMPFQLRAGDHLVIYGFNGRVQLKGSTEPGHIHAVKMVSEKASPDLLAAYEALTFAIRRDGTTVILEMKAPQMTEMKAPPIAPSPAANPSATTAATTPSIAKDSSPAWLSQTRAPEMNLEITMPPVATEITMHDGSLTVQNWPASVTESFANGTLQTSLTQGPLRLQAQKGTIKVDSHKGPLQIDSFVAKTTVSDLDGSLDLTNFGGETNLSGVHGRISARVHDGTTTVASSSGSVEFSNGRGSLNVAQFDGPVRGRTVQGSVQVALKGETEVEVNSEQGNVSVHLPDHSGASLDLKSIEGEISVADGLRSPASERQTAGAKTLGARLPGDGPGGLIAVRSKSGQIRIR